MKALFRVNYSHGQDYYASEYSTVIVSFSHNSIVLGRHSVAAQDPFGRAPGFVTWARTKGSARTGKWSGTQPSSRPIESCRPPGQLSSEFFMAFLVFFFGNFSVFFLGFSLSCFRLAVTLLDCSFWICSEAVWHVFWVGNVWHILWSNLHSSCPENFWLLLPFGLTCQPSL